MILFVNVFITDKGILTYDRGRYRPSGSRADVFKYMLSSLSVIEWSDVFIYYELDDNYKHRQADIDHYIKQLFPDAKLHNYRNDRQKTWQKALTEVFELRTNELVWFTCNDDHIFIDSDLEHLNRCCKEAKALESKHEFVSVQISHFPEHLAFHDKTGDGISKAKLIEDGENGFCSMFPSIGSIQIVNQAVLRYWFFQHDYGDDWIPRTDGPGRMVITPQIANFIPYKELVRHFDASSHAGVDINVCPPLYIPPGFFERNLKISYLGDNNREGFILVNPLKENYTSTDPNGADLRCTLDDIPLFWRSRISCVEESAEHSKQAILLGRNTSYFKLAAEKWNGTPDELLQKITPFFKTEGYISTIPSSDCLKKDPQLEIAKLNKRNWADKAPKVSVVILDPFIGRGDLRTVNSLSKQTLNREEYELIWVCVTDAMHHVAIKLVDTAIWIDQIRNQELGTYDKHLANNIGLEYSRGEIVLFVDSLQVFPSNFLASVVESFKDKDLACVVHQEWIQSQATWVQANYPGALSIRKENALRINGFDERNGYLGTFGGLHNLLRKVEVEGMNINYADSSIVIQRYNGPFPFHPSRINSGTMEPPAYSNHLELICKAISEKSPQVAITLGEELILWYPNFPNSYTTFASLCLIYNELDKALNYFAAAREVVPFQLEWYENYYPKATNGFSEFASLAQSLGLMEISKQCFEVAVKSAPKNVEIALKYALISQSMGDIDQAIFAYNKVLSLDAKNMLATIGLLKIS